MLDEDLRNDLSKLDPRSIYKKYLLGQDVWYFKQRFPENYNAKYDEFKHYVADNLGLSFNNVSIVGSAKTGFSFAPKKRFRAFCDRSDVDLVLVSDKFFYAFWDAYYDLFMEKYKFGYKSQASSIFRRFVTIKELPTNHSTFNNWISKVDKLNKDYQVLFNMNNDVKYRIYDCWDSVENYHIKGIVELKERMNNASYRSNTY